MKWALGSVTISKARGDDEIPAELFQILKDDAVKVLHSICQQIWKIPIFHIGKLWKLSSTHRTGKGQFSFQSQRRAILKNVQPTAQKYSFNMLGK